MSAPLASADAAIWDAWAQLITWTPEQRRANMPELLNAIRRLETRLLVLRQKVAHEISCSFEHVAPSRAGVVPDEGEAMQQAAE